MTKKHNNSNNKVEGFANLKICNELLRGISRKGYTNPTPIQNKTIPLIISGRDVVAMAPTGSGKTAAFLIPLFEKLKNPFCGESKTSGPRALIISPTRELAMQTVRFASEIGHFMQVKAAVLLGGERMDEDFRALHENPDIIIATPARLLHIQVEMGSRFNLSNVDFVVFDEGDRLFELGMVEQLSETFNRLPRSRQTVIFSATLPSNLVEFSRASLDNPVLVRLDLHHRLSEKLKLNMIHCCHDDKLSVLIELLHLLVLGNGRANRSGKDNKNVLSKGKDRNPSKQVIVFFATKHHVEYASRILNRYQSTIGAINNRSQQLTSLGGFEHVCVYSSMDPEARKINAELFRDGVAKVMLTTDLAARGIDIPRLDAVINFHFPDKPKLFQHRVGRVARAGADGTSYSLIDNQELAYAIDTFMFLSKPFRMIDQLRSTKSSGEGLGVAASSTQAVDDEEVCGTNGYLGSVPSSVIDGHVERIESILKEDSDAKGLLETSIRALGKYNRTKKLASAESVKRSKVLIDSIEGNILCHPLFSYANHVSDVQLQFRSVLKLDRPRKTIFETVHGKNEVACSALSKLRRAKELRDHLHVKNRFGNTDANKDDFLASKCRTSDVKLSSNQETSNKSSPLTSYRVPNLNGADITETGLSLQNSGFAAEAREAILELQNDEMNSAVRPVGAKRQRMTWDRKRKRFVGEKEDGKGNNKKIRTESGAVISASYKTDAYEKWLKSSNAGMIGAKTVSFEDDDNEDDDNNWRRGGKSQDTGKGSKKGSKSNGKGFKLLNSSLGRKNKFANQKSSNTALNKTFASQKSRELRPEQVMKKMKEKQKVKDFQKKRQMINKKKKSNK